MEDVFVKKKIIYHVTRQNLHFAHAPCTKNKNKKWQLRSGLTIKCFDLTVIFFGLVKNILGKRMIFCEK